MYHNIRYKHQWEKKYATMYVKNIEKNDILE